VTDLDADYSSRAEISHLWLKEIEKYQFLSL
jgi:hypothetical protein